MKTPLWLAIEGGGTKTRVLLATDDGTVLKRYAGGSASGLYQRPGEGEAALVTLLKPVMNRVAEMKGRVTRAALGGPMDSRMTVRVVKRLFGRVAITTVGERDIALALYGLSWGIALIAGTGASCSVVNEDGHGVSCGGCGPQFGDEGSGYWIGRRAIAAALRMADGRTKASLLADRLRAFYGIARMWDILGFVERGSGHVPGPQVAACVPVVFDLAREGDIAAREICRSAGTHLARLVLATADQVSWRTARVPLVMTGGVFNGGRVILASFGPALRHAPFGIEAYPPVCEPAQGLLNILRTSA